MAHGFQVFNADGSLQFDTSNRLFRTLTSVTTGTSNGSVAIPANPGGQVVAVVTPSSDTGQAARPTVSGASVVWDFDAPPGQRSNGTLSLVAF